MAWRSSLQRIYGHADVRCSSDWSPGFQHAEEQELQFSRRWTTCSASALKEALLS
jgi:hypothetical protein